MSKNFFYSVVILVVSLIWGACPATAQETKEFKVLVVMSYEESFQWNMGIKKAINEVLSDACKIRYFYMNTLIDYAGGKQKAKDAYELYLEYKPDGVIASDDNAQAMFVVPYLKDKVKTPVMFCGVNSEAGKYGYPASNVSGILELNHVLESIALLKQLVPSVKSIGYISQDNATGNSVIQQIKNEYQSYPVKMEDYKLVKTFSEALMAAEELGKRCDALLLETLDNIPDNAGRKMPESEIFPAIIKTSGKPAIGTTDYRVKYGCLCAVAKTPHEQGEVSARMLLKTMQGTPMSQISVTRNHKGKRVINVSVLKALGIIPRPEIIGSAELVITEK